MQIMDTEKYAPARNPFFPPKTPLVDKIILFLPLNGITSKLFAT